MNPATAVLHWTFWLIWIAAFLRRKKSGPAVKVDKRARAGILVESAGMMLVFIRPFWETPGVGRSVLAVVFFVTGCGLVYSAVGTLGRHWRVDAGLNADHRLVREGVYGVLRHPIYTSMLCMLIGSGCLLASWWKLAIAVAIFLLGTEMRVRVEDALLESRFGEEFRQYRRRVPAYLPGVR